MTDNFFSADQAESLLDGVPGDVPDHLRDVADLLAAAHRPATAGELSGMSATVQQFTAAATTPIETTRSITMFGTRLTRRAAAAIIATVLTGGTAAAAAGALPTPFTNNSRNLNTPIVETPVTTDAPETSEVTQSLLVDTPVTTEAPETSDATETENTDLAADEQDQVDQNDDANENDEQDQVDQNDDANENDEQDEVDQNDDGDQNNQQEQVGQNDDGDQEQDD